MMECKTRACWLCSRQLYGNKFTLVFIDGFLRKCHVLCAKNYNTARKMETYSYKPVYYKWTPVYYKWTPDE